MSKKLFLAPNRHMLSFALKIQGEEVSENAIKKGCLQAEYDWQDIDDEHDISTKDLLTLLTTESAGSACVYVLKDNIKAHQLLLPPVSAWIVHNDHKQPETLEAAIQQWLDYIEAAQQLLLLLPGQVVSSWPAELQSAAVFEHQLQLILEQDHRVALATQEWCSFVVRSENAPSAIALASELIKQKQSQEESEKEHFQANTALKQNINDLSNELEKVCAERNKLAELESQLGAKQTELDQSQQSVSDLQQKLNRSEAAHQQVSEALKTQEAQNSALTKNVEKLEESLSKHVQLKAVLEQTQSQLTELQEAYEAISQRLETNSKQLKEKTNQLEKASAQVSQLHQEIEKQRASKQATDEELYEVKNKATELEAQLTASGNEISEQKNELELATLRVSQLQQELEQLIQNKNALEDALKQSAAKEKTQAEQLDENSKALAEVHEELQLSGLKQTKLQKELESVFAKEKTLHTALQSAKAEAERAKSEASQSTSKYNESCVELELATLQINEFQEELKSISAKEQTLQTALQNVKAEAEQAKSEASQSTSKYNESCTELELATLQISQLQEELEQVFAREQATKQAVNDATTAQASAKQNADEATEQPCIYQQQIGLLTLQLSQLQEELEHYFVAYQKLKAKSLKAASEAESYWKAIIKARTSTFLVAQKVQVTGGFDKGKVHRLITRLNQVSNLKDNWDAFSVMFNDRNGNLDIEFHAPAENRIYPLSEFVKTGSSKVCDYSLINPFDSANCKVLTALNDEDKLLLVEIVREVSIHLQGAELEVLQQAEKINVQAWGPKLEQIVEALGSPDSMTTFLEDLFSESAENINSEQKAKELELESTATATDSASEQPIPGPVGISQTADGLGFIKLTLTQNMVAETNQHLSIRADKLSYADRSFNQFEFKIGAKRIEKNGFTQFGSIELREQQGVAPISDWSIAEEDKWGKKLVLSLGPTITAAEKQNITSLNSQDKAFVRAFLSALIKHIHKLDLNDIELANSLSDWHTMLISMLEQFNQTALKPTEKDE